MLVQSGHPHAMPLGIVDKLEARIFDSPGASSPSTGHHRTGSSLSGEDPCPVSSTTPASAPPSREVQSFSLHASKPVVQDVATHGARLDWGDLELPAVLANASVSYEVELSEVSAYAYSLFGGALVPMHFGTPDVGHAAEQ